MRERCHMLRGSESRTLASAGAFRVIPAEDLRDAFDKPLDPRHGELWHVREAGLVRTVRIGRDTTAVTLTREGRELLESHRRDRDAPDRQTFNDGIQRPRELKHDAAFYRAYLEEAERLNEAGAEILRVILENDLKAEFQTFLQEPNRDRADSDGRPERSLLEIESWAHEWKKFLWPLLQAAARGTHGNRVHPWRSMGGPGPVGVIPRAALSKTRGEKGSPIRARLLRVPTAMGWPGD